MLSRTSSFLATWPRTDSFRFRLPRVGEMVAVSIKNRQTPPSPPHFYDRVWNSIDQDLPALRSNAPTRIYRARHHRCTRCSVLFQDSSTRYHTLVSDARQGITWVTYKQEYLRGFLSFSPFLPPSLLPPSFSLSASRWWFVCTLVQQAGGEGERSHERETLCIGFAGQWVVASRPHRLASLRVTRASVSPRLDLSRPSIYEGWPLIESRVTYLPTYLPIRLSIRRTAPACRRASHRALSFCLPLYFPASELRATHAR